jgi:hypothetical protein
MNDKQIKKLVQGVMDDIDQYILLTETYLDKNVIEYVGTRIELAIRIAEKEGMKSIIGDV